VIRQNDASRREEHFATILDHALLRLTPGKTNEWGTGFDRRLSYNRAHTSRVTDSKARPPRPAGPPAPARRPAGPMHCNGPSLRETSDGLQARLGVIIHTALHAVERGSKTALHAAEDPRGSSRIPICLPRLRAAPMAPMLMPTESLLLAPACACTKVRTVHLAGYSHG
jgi:hypothetical protein